MGLMDKRRMCPQCRAFITTSDRTCPYCNEVVAPRAVDQRNPSPILGIIPNVGFVTFMTLLINVGDAPLRVVCACAPPYSDEDTCLTE